MPNKGFTPWGSEGAATDLNTTHRTGDGSDHADVATNTSHATGDGSDHADVATNTTNIAGLDYTLTAVKTGAYGAAIQDLVRCDTSGGGFVVTLPTAVGNDGRGITIKKVVSHANAVTMNTTAAQTMDGIASGADTITDVLGTVTYVSDGANWMRFPPA